MINAEFSGIWQFLDLGNVLNMEDAVAAAHSALDNGSCAGRENLGWYYLPVNVDLKELRELQNAAQRIRDRCDTLVVVGAGGSYLGARAGIELLRGQRYNSRSDGMRVFFAGHDLSSRSMNELEALLEGRDFCLNIISKSGTTTEPAIAARFLRWLLERRVGADRARERIFVTTDPTGGSLRKLAEAEGYPSFSIPGNVGGRFSVLTPAGLLPMAAAGIDISELITGAAEEMEALEERSLDNPAWMYAAARFLMHEAGKQMELLVSYEPDFETFGRWWQQLFGESEGKDGKGLFPVTAGFTADLHSLGQMIQQGRRNLFETTVCFSPPENDPVIMTNWQDLDNLNYLSGKTLSYVQDQAIQATTTAHMDGDVPCIRLDAGAVTPANVGALFYFFELSCAISAQLLGVNPFDQPGVEAYKRNLYRLLGRPEG